MNRPPMGLATAKSSPAMSLSEQLGFYAFVGVLLPATAWSMLRAIPLYDSMTLQTIVQMCVANLAVWYALSRLRTFARARLLSYVLPVNLIVFGGVLAVNAIFRAQFSYTLFIACALGTLTISYLVTTRIRHANPMLKHFVVPGGAIGTTLLDRGFLPLQSAQHFESLLLADEVSGSVIADLHFDHDPVWEQLLAKAALRGIPVYHYRLIEEAITGEVRISHLRENELGSLIPNLPYRTAKRIFDIAMVVFLSPLLLLIVAILAIAIKLDSPGGVFFYQERVGFRGEVFRMVKFRSMRVLNGAEEASDMRDRAITKDDDVRITRIGRLIRKTRLDEIPQAWNVLAGDMSWIGPRPEAVELSEWYESEIPFYSYRHIVRPGITGWAQVNQGHVADLCSIQTKLRFDFYYVKNLSLWLDVLIALKTLRVIVRGIGAK